MDLKGCSKDQMQNMLVAKKKKQEELQKMLLKQEMSYQRNLKRDPLIAEKAKVQVEHIQQELQILEKEQKELSRRLEIKDERTKMKSVF
eukprot:TRINITY_DN13900_c0_g1_i1.p1 TRINITY_DN13900_c0_g1~~TRINITY_DN13900_c0_g1_i1.p1  ORF type:complete len:100 (+),score=44.74 TRINITY_DN13900_c0_g1_i1:34-300(+)